MFGIGHKHVEREAVKYQDERFYNSKDSLFVLDLAFDRSWIWETIFAAVGRIKTPWNEECFKTPHFLSSGDRQHL